MEDKRQLHEKPPELGLYYLLIFSCWLCESLALLCKGVNFQFFYFDSMQCSKTLSHQQRSWSDQLWAGYRSRPGNNCCPWATYIKSDSLHICDSNSRRGILLSTKLQAGGLLQASVERTHVYSEARSGWQHNRGRWMLVKPSTVIFEMPWI